MPCRCRSLLALLTPQVDVLQDWDDDNLDDDFSQRLKAELAKRQK